MIESNEVFGTYLKGSYNLIIKVKISRHKEVSFICFDKSPLKMMKNAFYFMLKALVRRGYLSWCPDFSDHLGKRLDKKASVNL